MTAAQAPRAHDPDPGLETPPDGDTKQAEGRTRLGGERTPQPTGRPAGRDAPSDSGARHPALNRFLRHPVTLVTAITAALHLLWLGTLASSGGDLAAQDAWAEFAGRHPGSAYNLAWYGGMHPVSYSAVSPYVMSVLGVRTTMIIAGTVVGSAGTLLTQLMAKAMNRSLANVLFSDFGSGGGAGATEVKGSMKPIEASDVGVMMAFAGKVIVVPGYGMAVAQAQHKVWELCQLLIDRGVTVKFAIHPVAGRMPGHMNVLLAEANVPYDEVFELEDINSEFGQADVAFVIGANDVTNPAAKTDPQSPIFGMPILDVEKAKTVLFIKRGMGSGYAGVENELFFKPNTMMLFGDAKKVTESIVKAMAH